MVVTDASRNVGGGSGMGQRPTYNKASGVHTRDQCPVAQFLLETSQPLLGMVANKNVFDSSLQKITKQKQLAKNSEGKYIIHQS